MVTNWASPSSGRAIPANGASANGARADGASAGNGESALPSGYLRYLPSIYWRDPFMGRFLRIFEDVLAPVQTLVSRRTQQFDPGLASPAMLEALAAWVGVDIAEQLTEPRLRRLVKNTLLLQRWRGTRRGLKLALELVTGREPLITEFSPGLVLGEDAALGLNTSLSDGRPLQVHIMFNCRENELDINLVHAIIQRYKPAQTHYTLSFA